MNCRSFDSMVWPLLLLWAAPAPVAAQEKLDFRFKPSPGEVRHVTVSLDQTIDQTVAGTKQQIRQTVSLGYRLKVEEVDARGTATISIRYESAGFHARTASGAVDYDSSRAGTQAPPMAAAIAAMVGQGYSFRATADGKIADVQGADKFLAAVLSKLSIPDSPTRAEVENAVRRQISAENLKSYLQNLFAPYPERPIGVGESWTRSVQIGLAVPTVLDSSYVLKGRENGAANIEVSGKAFSAPDSVLSLGTTRIGYQLTGEQHGSIQVAERSGWMRLAELTQKLSGNATITAANTQPQTVPVSVESRMTVQVQDEESGH